MPGMNFETLFLFCLRQHFPRIIEKHGFLRVEFTMAEQCRIFSSFLKSWEPMVKPVSYPKRSYSAVIFPSVPISTLLTKQLKRADFALKFLISYAESSFIAHLISSLEKLLELSDILESSSSTCFLSNLRDSSAHLVDSGNASHSYRLHEIADLLLHLVSCALAFQDSNRFLGCQCLIKAAEGYQSSFSNIARPFLSRGKIFQCLSADYVSSFVHL